MKEAKVVVRFSVFSANDSCANETDKLVELLPKPISTHIKGENRYLTDGRLYPKPYEETSFDYENTYSVFELIKVHDSWTAIWERYFNTLKRIKKEYDFQYHLSYEITMNNMDYPSIYIPVSFSKILGDLGIEFSMFFYNE